MAFTKQDGRQDVSAFIVEAELADFTSGTALPVAEMPDDGIVVGGHIVVTTAFDSVTSDTLTVGDEDTDDRYASGVDGQAAASTDLTITGHAYTAVKDIVIKWTGSGGSETEGAVRLVVLYVRSGKADHTQG